MLARQEGVKQDILQKLSEKYPDIIKIKVVQKNDIIGSYNDLEYYIQSFAGKTREILLIIRDKVVNR